MGKSILTRDDILSSQDLKRELVEMPEWGGDVWIQEMTGVQRDQLEKEFTAYSNTGDGLINIRARIAVMTCTDEAGVPLFTAEHSAKLGLKSAAALDRIFEVARRLSGMRREDVEDVVGNLNGTVSGDSSSA